MLAQNVALTVGNDEDGRLGESVISVAIMAIEVSITRPKASAANPEDTKNTEVYLIRPTGSAATKCFTPIDGGLDRGSTW